MTWSSLRFNVLRSFVAMAKILRSCFLIQFLEELLKFLLNFTLLKLSSVSEKLRLFNHKRADFFGFQIFGFFFHFSASLKSLNQDDKLYQ